MSRLFRLLTCISVLTWTTPVLSAVPSVFHFSGRLDTTGGPFTGNIDITFKLYTTATGGLSFWDSTKTVDINKSRYHVILGDNVSLTPSSLAGGTVYLGVEVGGEGEMPDRIRLASVPYSLLAGDAAKFGGQLPGHYAPKDDTLAGLSCSSGDVAKWSGTVWECKADNSNTYNGTDFALSDQTCANGKAITNITSDGTIECSTVIMTETDPSVSMTTSGRVPRWDGAALQDGAIYDSGDGKVGIGTTSPSAALSVTAASSALTAITAGTGTSDKAIYAVANAGHGTGYGIYAQATAIAEGTYNYDLGTEQVMPGSYGLVFYGSYQDGRIEAIYPASDLINAGLKPGPITKIAVRLHYGVSIGTAIVQNLRVRMMHTLSTEVSTNSQCSFSSNGWTTVYGPTSLNIGGTSPGTYITLTLSTPFVWNGTSSLRVDLSKDGSGAPPFQGYGRISRYHVSGKRRMCLLRSNYATNGYSWPYEFSGATYAYYGNPAMKFTMAAGTGYAGHFQGDLSVSGSLQCTGCVDEADLATDAVGSAEIKSSAVGASEIATNAVGASEIGADAVGQSELAGNAVTGAHIVNGTITNDDVSTAAAIEGSKVSPNFGTQPVTAGHLYIKNSSGAATLSLEGKATGNFPEYDNDSITEYGVVVGSGNDYRKSIRFRAGGTAAAGSGGIKWGRYNSDDFYLHREGNSLNLDLYNYATSPDSKINIMSASSAGDVTFTGDVTFNGDVSFTGSQLGGTSVYRVINTACRNYNGLAYSNSCRTSVCGTYKESLSVTWKLHYYTCTGGCTATSSQLCTSSSSFSLVGYLVPN